MIDLTGVPELPAIPQLRPEVAAALKLAKDNLPPYPRTLLEELGACTGDSLWAKQSKPNFREWQWKIGHCWNGMLPYNVSCSLEEGYWKDDIDLSDIGYLGMWRGRTSNKGKEIYCVLPSMKHGEVDHGGIIEVGADLVRIGWKQEDLDAMVKQGYEIMMQMIAQYGEYRPEKK